jgi:hypothetical protein
MKYLFKVNRKRFESSKPKITGQEILSIAGLAPSEDYELLYKINEKGFTPIQLDEVVDLKNAGIEGFRARPYRKLLINVNGAQHEVEECFLTPNEILKLAKIDADRNYLKEIRSDDVEVTYKDDAEHKIAITRKSIFVSCAREEVQFVIVNSREKSWTKDQISFDEVVILQYGQVSSDPRVVYTITYSRGVPSKPEGSMVKGEIISVKNKMIFNVTQTNRS